MDTTTDKIEPNIISLFDMSVFCHMATILGFYEFKTDICQITIKVYPYLISPFAKQPNLTSPFAMSVLYDMANVLSS